MTINIKELFEQEKERFRSKFNGPEYFINRELSWMEFNKRVLHQACRKTVPILERLRFLGITTSNLDEFIMVRFSSVFNKLTAIVVEPEITGMTPEAEYHAVLKEIMAFKHIQQNVYVELRHKLKDNDIDIVSFKNLTNKEKVKVEKIFDKTIYPLLTPITIDTVKDFPLIRSKQLNILACLEDEENPNLNIICLIPVDGGIERMYRVDDEKGDEQRFILVEEIIKNFLHKIFMNKTILYRGSMKINREADIELQKSSDIYIVDRMKQVLIQRKFSRPISMDIDADIPKDVLKFLTRIFNIEKSHVFKAKHIVDTGFLASHQIKDPGFEYDPFTPRYPSVLIGEHDMFTALDNGDIVLHHPYESFGPVVKFLEHAAGDKDVLAIKQTLYRVSSTESPIVEALCRAAEAGKQVSVLLEIKARFDEDRNISLIDKLKISGCRIIYGLEELKTHCKFIVVVRRTKKGIKTYCHIGTGNYNDTTSKIYTDISYFTGSRKIGSDLIAIFNVLSGFSEPRDGIEKISYAPYNLRDTMYKKIDREIENAEKGKRAFITLKLNSLSDVGIIRRLYIASEKGVKIAIFCRGICSMKPINKNIVIKSIVGRFLEHSRIYYFLNDDKPEIYISSADMLTRNLDRRVEILVPVTEQEARNKILENLRHYFNDTVNTYRMKNDGSYELIETETKFNIHEYFMEEAKRNFNVQNVPKFSIRNNGKKT